MARFSEVLKIINGKNQTKVENPNGKYPIYGSGGIMGYADDYICNSDTVIIGRKGSINKPIFVETPFWNVDTAFGLEANREKLIPKYLFYFCQNFDFEKLNTTVTIPSLTKANLLDVEIPLVSIKEQEKIVNRLEKVDELISCRKEQLSKLDEFVKARFVEMFGDYGHNKSNVLLEEISDFVTVGIANSATHAYADNGIVMLRNQNIKENYLDENDLVYITPDFAKKYGSKKLAENDILVIRTGYPGVACLVPKKYEGCQTFTTLIVRLKNAARPYANYVCHYINSSFGKKYVEQSKVGVAQQNFGAKALAKMPIAVPPMELQEQFAAFVEQTEKTKAEVQKSLDELEILKKSLMQKYFG